MIKCRGPQYNYFNVQMLQIQNLDYRCRITAQFVAAGGGCESSRVEKGFVTNVWDYR